MNPDYKVDLRINGESLGGGWSTEGPMMQPKTWQLSIIPKGRDRSTYHSRLTALTSEDAVRQYINKNASKHTGAKVAQADGGIVLVTPVQHDEGYARMPAYDTELFHVEPAKPKPIDRARVVGRV